MAGCAACGACNGWDGQTGGTAGAPGSAGWPAGTGRRPGPSCDSSRLAPPSAPARIRTGGLSGLTAGTTTRASRGASGDTGPAGDVDAGGVTGTGGGTAACDGAAAAAGKTSGMACTGPSSRGGLPGRPPGFSTGPNRLAGRPNASGAATGVTGGTERAVTGGTERAAGSMGARRAMSRPAAARDRSWTRERSGERSRVLDGSWARDRCCAPAGWRWRTAWPGAAASSGRKTDVGLSTGPLCIGRDSLADSTAGCAGRDAGTGR